MSYNGHLLSLAFGQPGLGRGVSLPFCMLSLHLLLGRNPIATQKNKSEDTKPQVSFHFQIRAMDPLC